MTKKTSTKSIALALCAIAIATGCYIVCRPKEITWQKVSTLAELNPPAWVEEFIATAADPLLTVIHYNGRRLYCYDGIRHDFTSVIYLLLLRTIIDHKQAHVAAGWYVLAFHDGVHMPYKWPVLAFAATKDLVEQRQVFLMPDPEAINGYTDLFAKIDAGIQSFPWEQKKAQIFWRGSPTGGDLRKNFVNYAHTLQIADVGFKPYVTPEKALAYKYLFSIDGNSCAFSRMAWILYSNSTLIKHESDKVQWYYDQVQPYVHFIPVKNDFQDLIKQFAWAEANPTLSQNIALNGRKLAQKVFAKEAVANSVAAAFNAYQNEIQFLQTDK